MTDEEKAAQEKIEQEKKEAEELVAKKAAEEAANKIEIKDGKATLSEKQYNDLVGMKEDMVTYKEAKRKLEAELEAKVAAELKAKEEKLKEDGKFKELLELKEKENVDLRAKNNDHQIISALTVKLIEAGIKSEYVKLVDKSKVKMDGDTGEISGVDEVINSFVKEHPELVKAVDSTSVDTSQGGSGSGHISDEDLVKISGNELIRIKAEDPVLYERWRKRAMLGKLPGK